MKYALWLEVEGLDCLIEQISRDQRTKAFRAHITVQSGLSLETAMAGFEILKNGFSQFFVKPGGISGQPNKRSQFLYITLSTPELFRLRGKVSQSDFYDPHISLMYSESHQEGDSMLMQGLANLYALSLECEYRVTCLSIWDITDGNHQHWQRVCSFPGI